MNDNIELTDGSVSLRPYRRGDADLVFEAVRESLKELIPWMPWCHPDYSIEETREWLSLKDEAWANGTEYDFAITDARDGSLTGSCGLNKVDRTIYSSGKANLGYWVRTSRTKKGAATAATKLLAEFGFRELHLNRIELCIAPANKASQRVAEKSGATREGILRNRMLLEGKLSDAVLFSLVPGDIIG